MKKETLEKAKALENEIEHISKVIEFVKEHKREFEHNESMTNIFITDEADDYIDLNKTEVKTFLNALENKLYMLQQDFTML